MKYLVFWGRSQTTVPADGRFVWSYVFKGLLIGLIGCAHCRWNQSVTEHPSVGN